MSKKKWMYGDSWEKYPIENGIYKEEKTGGILKVHDILDGLLPFQKQADMIYSDTPWNTGNINSFYTKADLDYRTDFKEFTQVLFSQINKIFPKVCYLEIGKQNYQVFEEELKRLFPVVQSWDIVYYKKNPMKLLRGGYDHQDFDFTGIDDEETPTLAIKNEKFDCILDFCVGRGNTAVSAFKAGKRFIGTDLNKRRIANGIEKIAKLGGVWDVSK